MWFKKKPSLNLKSEHETTPKLHSEDPKEQFELGEKYYSGDGVKQSHELAFKFYAKAAQQGYADAQQKLGDLYALGRGVSENHEEALYWHTKAAEQNNI